MSGRIVDECGRRRLFSTSTEPTAATFPPVLAEVTTIAPALRPRCGANLRPSTRAIEVRKRFYKHYGPGAVAVSTDAPKIARPSSTPFYGTSAKLAPHLLRPLSNAGSSMERSPSSSGQWTSTSLRSPESTRMGNSRGWQTPESLWVPAPARTVAEPAFSRCSTSWTNFSSPAVTLSRTKTAIKQAVTDSVGLSAFECAHRIMNSDQNKESDFSEHPTDPAGSRRTSMASLRRGSRRSSVVVCLSRAAKMTCPSIKHGTSINWEDCAQPEDESSSSSQCSTSDDEEPTSPLAGKSLADLELITSSSSKYESRITAVNEEPESDDEAFKAGMMGHSRILAQDAGDGSVCSYTGQEHPHPEAMEGWDWEFGGPHSPGGRGPYPAACGRGYTGNDADAFHRTIVEVSAEEKVLPIASFRIKNGEYSSVDSCQYPLGAGNAKALARAIQVITSPSSDFSGGVELSTLHLQGSHLGVKGGEHMVAALSDCSELQRIDLSKNRLGPENIAQLGLYLPRFRQLASLKLGGNAVDDVALATVATGLRTLKQNLKGKIELHTLDLSDNNLAQCGKVLASQIEALPKLTTCLLSYNRLTPATTALVMTAILKVSLTELDVSWNRIGNAGAMLLGTAIGKSSSLKTVKVVHCTFMARGAMVLLDGLQRNTSVEHMDISENAIGEDGGRALLRLWASREMDCDLVWRGCNLSAHDLVKPLLSKDMIEMKKVNDAAMPQPKKQKKKKKGKKGAKDPTAPLDKGYGALIDWSTPSGQYVLDTSCAYQRLCVSRLCELAEQRGGGCIKARIGRGNKRLELQGMQSPPSSPYTDLSLLDKLSPASPDHVAAGISTFSLSSSAPPVADLEPCPLPNCVDPNAKYQVPKSGIVQITFEDGPVVHPTRISQLGLGRILREVKKRSGVSSGDNSGVALIQLTARTWRLDSASAHQLLQAQGFFETHSSAAETVGQLYVSLVDLTNQEILLQQLNQDERAAAIKLVGPLVQLEVRRPDGRYRFDLSNKYQRETALRLYELAQEQAVWLRKKKQKDVSQRGDGVCWRNVKLDNQSFKVPIKHWDIPTASSVLEFDMTSFARVVGEPMTDDEFTLSFIPKFRQLVTPGLSTHTANAASWLYWLRRSDAEISVAMLKQIMLLLPRETDRIECVVVMASGLTDRENIYEVLQHVGPAAASILRERIGWINLMSPEHPDGFYTLDLADPEQCAVMAVLAALIHSEHICESCRPPTDEELALQEAEEAENATKKKKTKPKKLKKPKCVESFNVLASVFHPDGFQAPVEGQVIVTTPPQVDFKVPAKWMDADKLPKQGVLQIKYGTIGPADQGVRAQLAKELAKWKPPEEEEKPRKKGGKGKKKK